MIILWVTKVKKIIATCRRVLQGRQANYRRKKGRRIRRKDLPTESRIELSCNLQVLVNNIKFYGWNNVNWAQQCLHVLLVVGLYVFEKRRFYALERAFLGGKAFFFFFAKFLLKTQKYESIFGYSEIFRIFQDLQSRARVLKVARNF